MCICVGCPALISYRINPVRRNLSAAELVMGRGKLQSTLVVQIMDSVRIFYLYYLTIRNHNNHYFSIFASVAI